MKSNTSTMIDEFGLICAQAADLENRKKKLRQILIAAIGEGAAEGDLYRVTISVADRETLDMDAVRAKLSPQFIAAHTNKAEVTTVKASARNALKLVA
jgi:hypothetical protein